MQLAAGAGRRHRHLACADPAPPVDRQLDARRHQPSSPFVRGKAPKLVVDVTDYGYLYAGIRPLDESEVHIRSYHFIMPFHQIRPSRSDSGVPCDAGHIWVPMDDYNCMVYNWMYSTTDRPLTEDDRRECGIGNGPDFVDQTTFRSIQNRSNDYGLNREVQRTESYTGIDGINQQDRALQETMGASSTARRSIWGRPTRRSARRGGCCARRS